MLQGVHRGLTKDHVSFSVTFCYRVACVLNTIYIVPKRLNWDTAFIKITLILYSTAPKVAMAPTRQLNDFSTSG